MSDQTNKHAVFAVQCIFRSLCSHRFLNLWYLVMLMEIMSFGAVQEAAGPYWISASSPLMPVPVLTGEYFQIQSIWHLGWSCAPAWTSPLWFQIPLVGFCDGSACVAFGCAGPQRVHHVCCGLSDLTCDSLWKFGMSPHLSHGLLKVLVY